jgi:hypothetical protein
VRKERYMIPNLIVSLTGDPKTGKTHFALTYPEPLVVYSFDLGLDRVLPNFVGKNITVKKFPIPLVDSRRPKPYALEIWNRFYEEYKEDVESGEYATVVVDTGTALAELARHARTEELGQQSLLPVQYGEVNARLSAVLTAPRISGINLVATHHLKDVYVDDKATGEQTLDGYKRTEGLVDIVFTTKRVVRGAGRDKKTVIELTIKDCGYDLSLCGQTLDNATYDDLIAMLGFE